MKKALPLMLAFLLLTSCAPKSAPEYRPADVVTALTESAAFSEKLEPLDQDVFCGLYGLDAATLVEGAVYCSTGATAEEFAVLKLKDQAAADSAYQLLKTRLADQKEANREYRPQDMPKLESALVDQRGTTVLLVIANDNSAAQKALA
ncbi:MAG: DUF4358 domain-containing protein, partial [Oscillospiraceae bacterium]